MSDNNKNLIQGSGGGGGKGGGGSPRKPTEVRDNQYSTVNARVLVAYSSGQTDGLLDGRNSIFLDGTKLQGNFSGVWYGHRSGSQSQTNVRGFLTASSVVNINSEMDSGSPVIRTVQDGDVDAVRVIITIPALQLVQTNGDIKGTSVAHSFAVRDPATGVWESRGSKTISGKSSGPFQRQYTISGPSTITGAWDWRVIRTTANSASSRLSNDSVLQAVNEIRYGRETYPGTAYVSLEFDTQDFGNNIPALAFRVRGVRVRVPSNYTDPDTRIPNYTGVWDGSWTWSSTENPVWHLYHLITDHEIGLGMDESYVDRYNFYEAARYCDAVDTNGTFVGIPDGSGGVRRRFTLNTQVVGQKDGLELLQDIASSMRAVLYFGAGAIVLKQDMPRSTSRIVTNENVQDGTFYYSSTAAKDRITVAKVAYNDPDDFFTIKYARYPEENLWSTDPNVQRYGRNEVEVTKFGCSSEAEAYSFAKWIVYSSCNESRTVTFTGSTEFMLVRPGDIIEVMDRRLAGAANFSQRYGGRIAGGTISSVDLDYEVNLTVGENYSITIVDADGKGIETRTITTSGGIVNSVSVDTAFTNVPVKGFTWLIQGTDIAAQKFSVIHTERKDGLEVEVFAIQHDDQKFAAVENNIEIVPTPYTKINVQSVESPTNIRYQVIPRWDDTKGALNTLLVQWDASVSEFATRYHVRWRKDFGIWRSAEPSDFNEFEIAEATSGEYEFLIYAQSPLGYESLPLAGSYTLTYGGTDFLWDGVLLTIQPPTITSPAEFGGKDFVVAWERNLTNDVPGIVFKEYRVEFVVDSVVQREVLTASTFATYYYDDMVSDQGTDTPSRIITVNVYERDTLLHESAAATAVFNNPVPTPPNFTVSPSFTHTGIEIIPLGLGDVAGYFVFRGTSSDFVADATSLIHAGSDTSITDNGLDINTTYWYRVAAWDLFDSNVDNAIKSGAISATTQTVVGELVNYETEGIVFSTSGAVASWTAGTVYVRVDGTVSTVGTSAGSVDLTAAAPGTKSYIYFDPDINDITTSSDLVSVYQGGASRRVLATWDGSVLIEGEDAPIIDGASILAETVGATQVVTSGLITNTAQINNGVIESANIGDLQVERLKIANGSVTRFVDITTDIDPPLVCDTISNLLDPKTYPAQLSTVYNIPSDPELIPDEILIVSWQADWTESNWIQGTTGDATVRFNSGGDIDVYGASSQFVRNIAYYTYSLQHQSWSVDNGAQRFTTQVLASEMGMPYIKTLTIPRFTGGLDNFIPGGSLHFRGGYYHFCSYPTRYQYELTVNRTLLQLIEIFK